MVDPNGAGYIHTNWVGLIDEVKLYNRVLTLVEIQDIHNY